jgi:DNA-binding transcriptional LysR family regulator
VDITLARTFLAIAETGTFVEAADRLNVTQSTVSTRVKTLEDLIGQRLFERSKAGASPTPAGLQFQRHASALVRVWEHARLDVALAEEHRDHLAVGSQLSFWDGFLLQWLSRIRDEVPDIAVSARLGTSPQLMEQLSEGTLDLAIMHRPVQHPGLVIEHLFEEELLLVTSGDPKAARPGEGYVFVNWGPEFQADHALAYPELKRPGLYLELGSLGVGYLLDKRASGYFPARAVRPLVADGQLALLETAPRFVYSAYAVYPDDRAETDFDQILENLRRIAAQI